jgi:CheY-like chemotaxis protein
MTNQTTVLVAESDDELAKVLTQAIAGHGWSVLQARDAVSATATILRHRPDAVVLNQKLPGGGGLLALRRLRASIHTAMTPVIAIAGTRDGDEAELRQHGADECVTVPLDAGAIAEWIRKRLLAPTVVMEAPASIIRDPERLASLAQTALMDTSPSEPLDILTRVAASLLGVPVALVSLVDGHRQFFKSHVGLPEPLATVRETPLTYSFCQWVVADHTDLVVTDAREHPALKHNRGFHEFGVIAYAGVLLTTISGSAIGSFCAVDTKPRAWSADDTRILKQLASVAGRMHGVCGVRCHGARPRHRRRDGGCPSGRNGAGCGRGHGAALSDLWTGPSHLELGPTSGAGRPHGMVRAPTGARRGRLTLL